MNLDRGNEVVCEWRISAPFWEKHSKVIRALFQPITVALLDALSLGPADFVLDVGGGMGEPALPVSEHLRDTGAVVCTDRAEAMRAAASRRARNQRRGNIE